MAKFTVEWILCAVITSALIAIVPPSVESQMVPISEVISHDIKKEKVHAAKAKVHAKIAEKHLEKRGDVQNGQDSTSKEDKVTRKDKPVQFQDPAKHASETGLLNFLLEQYKLYGQKDVEEQLEILQNLEHFSHKFENGRDLFTGTDALRTVLLPALNSTTADIRKAAASIFAIAAQNNPVVQSKSIEAGVVRHLIHLVTFDKEVRTKALFAITSILRNYPDAQKEFIKLGGISEIVKVAYFPETRRRSLTFIMDLLNERKFCTKSKADDDNETGDNIELASDDPCDELNLLHASLKSSGWCELLQDSVQTVHNSLGGEDQVLVIEAVESSLDLCTSSFTHLEPFFIQLLRKFENDPDFETTKTQTQNIIAAISAPKVSSPKIEL